MMEPMDIGQYKLKIDKTATEEYYRSIPKIECTCQGCRNYVLATERLSPAVKQLFSAMGIDPTKEAEVYVYYVIENGKLSYGGFYHLCGEIINEASLTLPCYDKIGKMKTKQFFDESKRFEVDDSFNIWFTSVCSLVGEGFPEPVIQMEILAELDWMLDEDNDYVNLHF